MKSHHLAKECVIPSDGLLPSFHTTGLVVSTPSAIEGGRAMRTAISRLNMCLVPSRERIAFVELSPFGPDIAS